MLYSEKLKSFAAAHPCETITVCGAQYRYILCGRDTGRTLVFLNGGMNTLEMWMDYLNGSATDWWLSSPYTYNTLYAWGVYANGISSNYKVSQSLGIRPAIILPSDMLAA